MQQSSDDTKMCARLSLNLETVTYKIAVFSGNDSPCISSWPTVKVHL